MFLILWKLGNLHYQYFKKIYHLEMVYERSKLICKF